MRHDAKLGLALGMLVIGFAVAFCFPRQPVRVVWEKPEVPARNADSSLNFLPIRAYQSLPADAAQLASSAAPAAVPVSSVTAPQESAAAPLDVLPPAPIMPIVEPPAPEDPAAVIPKPAAETTPLVPVESESSVPETYRVRAGDTLSGIASKWLGSSAKYQELFEANRDVLTSPNDLKIGMELRIPGKSPLKASPELLAEEKRPGTKAWNGIEVHPQLPVYTNKEGVHQPPAVPWVTGKPVERN